jgi:hypothetical protein
MMGGMTRTAIVILLLVLVACKESGPAPKQEPASTPAPTEQKPAPPSNVRPAATAEVPVNKWVRTTGYDGKAYLGFTYMDRVKGLCIKGEFTDGISDEELSKRLQKFPPSSFEPYPDGHAATPLTDEEIARLKLPNPPDWVSEYR